MAGHFGNDPSDGYQARPYRYEPKWEKQVDRHPDRRPSDSRAEVVARGRDLVWMVEVRGLGVMTMRAGSDLDDPKGRLTYYGLGIFTDEEIQFDDAIDRNFAEADRARASLRDAPDLRDER